MKHSLTRGTAYDLRALALEVIEDPKFPVGSKARILANSIITYFEPDYFEKAKSVPSLPSQSLYDQWRSRNQPGVD